MSDVWDAVSYEAVIRNVDGGPLPECNRGSWYCPVATESDATTLAYLCERHGVERIYDLGAGTLELSVAMDQRGYDVVAYESLSDLIEFALERLPENDVDVRNRDYYADWSDIRDDTAAFVALGKLNSVPGDAPNGIVVDGMSVSGQPDRS